MERRAARAQNYQRECLKPSNKSPILISLHANSFLTQRSLKFNWKIGDRESREQVLTPNCQAWAHSIIKLHTATRRRPATVAVEFILIEMESARQGREIYAR